MRLHPISDPSKILRGGFRLFSDPFCGENIQCTKNMFIMIAATEIGTFRMANAKKLMLIRYEPIFSFATYELNVSYMHTGLVAPPPYFKCILNGHLIKTTFYHKVLYNGLHL